MVKEGARRVVMVGTDEEVPKLSDLPELQLGQHFLDCPTFYCFTVISFHPLKSAFCPGDPMCDEVDHQVQSGASLQNLTCINTALNLFHLIESWN